MILYCADAPVLLFPAIGHYLKYNREKTMVLMIDKNIYENRNADKSVINLKKKGLIHDIISESIFMDTHRHISVSQYEKYCLELFDNVFNSIKYNLDDFEEIYCVSDTWEGHFNLYLNLIKKPYYWISASEKYLEGNIAAFCSNEFKELHQKHQFLTPHAQYAKPIIFASTKEDDKKRLKKEYKEWDKKEVVNSLKKTDIETIIDSFYMCPDFKNGGVLLLVNSYGYMRSKMPLCPIEEKLLGFSDYEERELFTVMNKIALDYFAHDEQTIYIKPHPNNVITENDISDFYDNRFKKYSDAPIELLISHLKKKKVHFSKILGFASTSLDIVNDSSLGDKLSLGDTFIQTWTFYDSLFASAKICEHLGLKGYTHKWIYEQINLINISLDLDISINEKDIIGCAVGENDWLSKDNKEILIIDCNSMRRNNTSFDSYIAKAGLGKVLIFLNSDYYDDFFDYHDFGYVTELLICKNADDSYYPIESNTEKLWVYTKNKSFRNKLTKFNLSQHMPWRKIDLQIITASPTRMLNDFNIKKIYKANRKIQEISHIEQRLLLTQKIIYTDDISALEKELTNITDIYEYLDMLMYFKKEYTIAFAVRDTPGSRMDDKILMQIHNLGFTEFTRKLWKMYCGLIHGNQRLIDDMRPENIERGVILNNSLKIELLSSAYKSGDCCKIIINNTDYSVNRRGINIVVYDAVNMKVVDSVCYDAHILPAKFYRP